MAKAIEDEKKLDPAKAEEIRQKKIEENEKLIADSAKDSSLLKERGVADPDKIFSEKNPPKQIEGEHSIEDDMANVNPLYKGNFGPSSTTQNCVLCSVTYDMRRRGYDVTAKLTKKPTYGDELAAQCYKNGEYERHENAKTFSDLEKEMTKKHPEKSRGVLMVNGFAGGWFGHAMSWEIKGGKLVIIDSQTNKKYTPTSKELKYFIPRSTKTMRTDNLEVDWKGISKVCAEMLDKN